MNKTNEDKEEGENKRHGETLKESARSRVVVNKRILIIGSTVHVLSGALSFFASPTDTLLANDGTH